MTNRKGWAWGFLVGTALLGCDEAPEQEGPTGTMDGGVVPSNDGSVGDAGDAATPAPVATFAVVSGDFRASTSVSLLDAEGKVFKDHYVHTGSTLPGLVTALGGDVELPKQSGESGTLVLLDRRGNDVITRIRIADGTVLGQVKAQTPATQGSTSAFSANPQDYVLIDAQTAWVVRSDPNVEPGAAAIDLGNDLLRINPTTMERTGERIDLSALNATATPSGGGAAVTLYAKPTRVVRLGKTLVVGITRAASDFSALGDGAVALVDLDTRAVTAFALPGFKNCVGVSAVPNDTDSVLVSCAGDFTATARDTAGLALIGVSNGAATLEHAYRARDDAAAPNPLTSSAVSLGGTLAVAAANDFTGATPDVLAVVNLASGQKTEIASAAPGQGRFGSAAFDAQRGLLLVADASVDAGEKPTAGVRRFRRNADGSFTELELTRVAVPTGLPVRHVYPL